MARDAGKIAALSRFCIVDEWSANLDNAMLSLGAEACAYHGLDARSCRFGILEFVRCYEPAAAAEIVNVFERAAADGLPFHYSAEIRNEPGPKSLVHCFGQYDDTGDPSEGPVLNGIFLMSRRKFQRC